MMLKRTAFSYRRIIQSFVGWALLVWVTILLIGVVLFAVGTRSGVSYQFSLGSLQVLRVSLSEENFGVAYGPGLFLISLLAGLIAAALNWVRPPQ